MDEALAQMPIIAILRGVKPDEILAVAEALYSAGVRVLEVPLNSPEPLDSIARLKAMTGRVVYGAGTVLGPGAVDAVAQAGGKLIVSPNTDPAVIRHAVECGMVPMPGFASATEAFCALAAGARYLKLFPASTYGPRHLKALKAVLPAEAVVQPVGGVRLDEMPAWWAAGARGFGLGGSLYKPGFTPAQVKEAALAAVAAVTALMTADQTRQ
ncbi:MAG: 2-dehydro-3-deoxy-6-phosphogalactonate aldolase [Caulobacterales bacterium 32-69-10]|nr:MAG: 2-dehydro-3-deoxy-6-phosphogalactonate aldolase [Caulobacterales bacterium 32-69-10]